MKRLVIVEFSLVISADSDLDVGEGYGLRGRGGHVGIGAAELCYDADAVELLGANRPEG